MACYTFGPFLLDSEARTLSRASALVPLTAKAFDVLLLLIQNRGRLVTKDELLAGVWRSVTVEEANLTQAMSTLRKALGERPRDNRFIATISGAGYQFVGDVTELPSTSTDRRGPVDQSRKGFRGLVMAACGTCALAVGVTWMLTSSRARSLSLGAMVQITNDGRPKSELVTDGVRVFYAAPLRMNLTQWHTYQVPVAGGEPSRFSDEEWSPVAISPDSAQLLLTRSSTRQTNLGYTRPHRFWSRSLGGAPPRIIPIEAHDAAWSADGTQIVYAVRRELALATSDGALVRKLAALPGIASGLEWSPRRDLIRFTLYSGLALKDAAIWEIPAAGGQPRPVLPGWGKWRHENGRWTPNGDYFVFSAVRNGLSQLYALGESRHFLFGSQPEPIHLTTAPIHCFLPTPTPDGKKLLFYGMVERNSLFKFNSTAGTFEPLLPGVSGAHVNFSADGEWITYSSYPGLTVWRAAADGSERLQLTPPEMVGVFPTISPDGSRVAFAGGYQQDPVSIFVVLRDGGAPKAIPIGNAKGLLHPAWSPDGRSLVIGSVDPTAPGLYRFDFATNVLSVFPASAGLILPAWSPDGKHIAAIGKGGTLTVYNLKTLTASVVSNLPDVFRCHWSRNGTHLYFVSNQDQQFMWFRLRLSDRRVDRIVTLPDDGALPAKPSRGVPRWINRWVGITPDDSLLIARSVGSTEIYSATLTVR